MTVEETSKKIEIAFDYLVTSLTKISPKENFSKFKLEGVVPKENTKNIIVTFSYEENDQYPYSFTRSVPNKIRVDVEVDNNSNVVNFQTQK